MVNHPVDHVEALTALESVPGACHAEGMTAQTDCVDALRGFIERADREELGAAQQAILQYALSFGDTSKASGGLAELQSALSAAIPKGHLHPLQGAFLTIVDAMIDRTKTEVAKPPVAASP